MPARREPRVDAEPHGGPPAVTGPHRVAGLDPGPAGGLGVGPEEQNGRVALIPVLLVLAGIIGTDWGEML